VKRRYIVVATALLLAALAWHVRDDGRADASAHASPAASTPTSKTAARAPGIVGARSLAPLPARSFGGDVDSLRGSAVDGAVNVDASGHALADRDLRRLFDYWLTRLGERALVDIRADVLTHLRDVLRLDAATQAQALVWFDLYVATGQAVAALPRSGDLAADAALVRSAHEHYLGSELARAWFGTDDDYAAYTAQRLALQRDPQTDARLRSQQLDELDASLDAAERNGRHAATDFQIAVAQTQDFDSADADGDTRFQERAALWGEAAALRLAAMDDADATWQARVQTYARARAALLADRTLSDATRAARLDALLAKFGKSEQRRLLSLAQANLLPDAR